MKRKNKEREAGRKEARTVHSKRKHRRANASRGARRGEGKPPHSHTTRSRVVEMPHGQVTRVGSRMKNSTTRGSRATAQPQPVVSSAARRRTQKGRAKRWVRSRWTAYPHRGHCWASVTTPRRDHHAHGRQRGVAATTPATRAPPPASPSATVAFSNRGIGHQHPGLWLFVEVRCGLSWFVVVCAGLRWFVVVCCGLWWFAVCGGLWVIVVVCGGLWWFVVVCGLWRFVGVCGGLWWFVVVCGLRPPALLQLPGLPHHFSGLAYSFCGRSVGSSQYSGVRRLDASGRCSPIWNAQQRPIQQITRD